MSLVSKLFKKPKKVQNLTKTELEKACENCSCDVMKKPSPPKKGK